MVQTPPRCVFVLLAVCGTMPLACAGAGAADVALSTDDECTIAGGQCALHAVQRRARASLPASAAAAEAAPQPSWCKVWFDGCNTCTEGACTRKSCPEYEEPACKEVQAAPQPSWCKVWFDGCNTCTDGSCTRKVCSAYEEPACKEAAPPPSWCKVWFDGCNTCTDGSCTRKVCSEYEEPACKGAAPPPSWCKVWFDGCNTCTDGACTRKFCSEYEKPACKEALPQPSWCKVWFDGCNTCRNGACTEKFCSDYEKPACKEVQAASQPSWCKVWFDGCNTCSNGACTKKFCSEYEQPACKEGPGTEEMYKKSAAMQFSSPAFEKDTSGALTDEGGLKICTAFIKTVGKGLAPLTPEKLWEYVQLYHGKGEKVKVTESVWQDATWPLAQEAFAKEAANLEQLTASPSEAAEESLAEEGYGEAAAAQLSSPASEKEPLTKEVFMKFAATQFSSPAFEKDASGALTDKGGLKICTAFLKTIGKGVDLPPETLWQAVQLYHGKGKKVKVTQSVWQEATWPLAQEAVAKEEAGLEQLSAGTSEGLDLTPEKM